MHEEIILILSSKKGLFAPVIYILSEETKCYINMNEKNQIKMCRKIQNKQNYHIIIKKYF